MKPDKTKKVQEDTDPKAAPIEKSASEIVEKEIDSEEASSEERDNPGKEPYVDFSKLF